MARTKQTERKATGGRSLVHKTIRPRPPTTSNIEQLVQQLENQPEEMAIEFEQLPYNPDDRLQRTSNMASHLQHVSQQMRNLLGNIKSTTFEVERFEQMFPDLAHLIKDSKEEIHSQIKDWDNQKEIQAEVEDSEKRAAPHYALKQEQGN